MVAILRPQAPVRDHVVLYCASANEFVPVKYLEDLQGELRRLNYGRIATITGRYYAMDRDKRWVRIKVAFDALTGGIGEASSDPAEVC